MVSGSARRVQTKQYLEIPHPPLPLLQDLPRDMGRWLRARPDSPLARLHLLLALLFPLAGAGFFFTPKAGSSCTPCRPGKHYKRKLTWQAGEVAVLGIEYCPLLPITIDAVAWELH